MPEWLTAILITSAVGMGVGIFARALPKEKLCSWTVPVAEKAGRGLSSLLRLRLGKKAADRFEQGIIVTMATVATMTIDAFIKAMLADNGSEK